MSAVHTAGAQATLEIEDYVVTPMTGLVDGKGSNELLLSRVNTLREEAGGAKRFFISDLNGPLYIFDKDTKKFSVYLDFNGNEGKKGIFRRLTIMQGYGNGLNGFYLDPDYTRNGKFYTVHIEDPALPGSNLPNNASFPALNVSGYTTTAAIKTPGPLQNEGVLDRVDRLEPVELDVRRHGARAAARAAEYAQPPAGRSHLQPDGAAGRSRLARPVYGMRRRRVGRIEDRRDQVQPAAARQPRGQDPPHHSRSERARGDEHGQRERPLSHSQ